MKGPLDQISATSMSGAIDDLDDVARLIEQVLADLGATVDASAVAQRVRRLQFGLPAEDEFIAICSWLGRARIVHKLDQHQAPQASTDTYQVPDLLAHFDGLDRPVLIEVKKKATRTFSATAGYRARLIAYADLLGLPLLIAWKYHGIWALFDIRALKLAKTNYNITFGEAMRQNLLGELAGDVAYKISPGAGIRIGCRKEKLLARRQDGDTTSEDWNMRIDSVAFMTGGGAVANDLHQDVQALFTTWDLEEVQSHTETHVTIHFVAGTEGMIFGHQALVHLLNWSSRDGERIDWRGAIRRDKVVSSLENFHAALQRGLEQGVVSHILHQQPAERPPFLAKRS